MEVGHPYCSARLASSELTQGNIIGDHRRYKRRKSIYRIDFSNVTWRIPYEYGMAWYCTFEVIVFQYEVSSLEASHEMLDTSIDYSLKSFLCLHGCLFRSICYNLFSTH